MGEKTIILKENKKSKSALAKARSDKKAQQLKDDVSITELIIKQLFLKSFSMIRVGPNLAFLINFKAQYACAIYLSIYASIYLSI